jgi:filamentous hemagglutinin
MAGGMLSGANNSGHAEGTTKAGVSEGALLIRDQNRQQQDVTTLNRDTDHANDGSISPIFNREKEQNRLRQAQLIGEIAGQAMDVIRTQGDIAGLKAQTDPAALAQAREQLKKDDKPFRESDVLQRAYNNAMQQYGTGSDLQKAAQAVTGALTALAGNNLAGALASGASPYLATEIKKRVGEDNIAANAMAHAVLGAVTAQLNNQSAVAGGLGAGGGELAARYIAGQLFPGKTADQLSESEKQQVSALSQLASGLAGGLATGDTGGAVTAAQAGKNAVENNALSDIAQAQSEGKTLEQKAGEYVDAENERYKKANCGGMSAEACSVKMYTERREALKDMTSAGADFLPVVGDIKSFAEAQSALDYLAAAIGIIPGAGDAAGKAIKAAETALKKGDVAEASRLINQASSEAYNSVNGLKLNKSLASESQLSELSRTGGLAVAGAGTETTLRVAEDLAKQYGGKASDWSKVTSSSYKAADGTIFEIHAYRNSVTGKLVEPKSIPIKK